MAKFRSIMRLLCMFCIFARCTAEEEPHGEIPGFFQMPEYEFNGYLDAAVSSGYLSSSGTLSDTRPVTTQIAYGQFDFAQYGYVDGYLWAISALHNMQRERHRMLVYELETAGRYGYVWKIADGFSLDTKGGFLWNPPIGYKHSNMNYWGPTIAQSFENPYVTPYWSGLWLLAPRMRGRVRFGLKKKFPLGEKFSLTPSLETVWMDRRRFGAKYGDDPEKNHVFGGAFATVTVGLQFTWRISPRLKTYASVRQLDVINSQARHAVRRSSDYWAKCDWPVAKIGVEYDF